MNNGAIKKIDELGRIVIPRSIRKSLSIKKDDSLEVGIDDNAIKITKTVSIKNYDQLIMKYCELFSSCNIKMLVTNRENILFNNTEIKDLDVPRMVELALFDLIKEANIICNNCDVRPIIIDSNPEGIVFICESSCNEIVGKIFNKLVTTELDITC